MQKCVGLNETISEVSRHKAFGKAVVERSGCILAVAIKPHRVGLARSAIEAAAELTPDRPSEGARRPRNPRLRAWRTDHFVPALGVSSCLCSQSRMEVEAVRSVNCSDAVEGEPDGGQFHGLAEQLLLRARLRGSIRCDPAHL